MRLWEGVFAWCSFTFRIVLFRFGDPRHSDRPLRQRMEVAILLTFIISFGSIFHDGVFQVTHLPARGARRCIDSRSGIQVKRQ